MNQDLVRKALCVDRDASIADAVTLRALKRAAQLYGDVAIESVSAGHLVASLSTGDPLDRSPVNRWECARRVIECLYGYDPDKDAGYGYEPVTMPIAYEDDPVAFTTLAIDRAIDLMLHPAGIEAVAFRIVKEIALSTRNKMHKVIAIGISGREARRKVRVFEPEIARISRICEIFAHCVAEEERAIDKAETQE